MPRLRPFPKAKASPDVRAVIEPYVRKALPAGWITGKTVWHVNPTGAFVVGGPDGDCGLTGRKIIVDTYGGAAPHGGGAFSGKDPTKVDRSAAYAARYLAIHGLAHRMGMKTNVTMLYGHIETEEDRVDHLLKLRAKNRGITVHEMFEPELPRLCASLKLRNKASQACFSFFWPVNSRSSRDVMRFTTR